MSLSWKALATPLRALMGRFHSDQQGMSNIEAILAVAIVGIVAVTFLSGVAGGTKATAVASEQAVAESLLRSELEYIRAVPYAATYAVDPELAVPVGWTVSTAVGYPHGSDDGLQEVTVTAQHHGRTILSLLTYKMNR